LLRGRCDTAASWWEGKISQPPGVFMNRKEISPSCGPPRLQAGWYPAQPVFVPSARHLCLCFYYSQAVNTENEREVN